MNSFRVAKPSSGLFMVGFSTYPSPFVHYSWLRNAPDGDLLCKREEERETEGEKEASKANGARRCGAAR